MNPIDILGGMLNKRGGGGGLGGNILESILRGGRPGSGQPSGGAAIPGRPSGSPQIVEPRGRQEEFDSLEDLLRHAQGRQPRRAPTSHRQPAPPPQSFPQPDPRIARRQTDFDHHYQQHPDRCNQQAEVLIRAMVNAAKADGQIDQQEQDSIVQQMGHVSQDDIQWLRTEFARPLDVRDFVWSVPLGMERQVYAMSLMAIRLDNNAEVQYLRDLAFGLRMTPEECDQLHQEFGAPQIR